MFKKFPTIAATLVAMILFATPSLAINKTCLDNSTLQVNTTYYIDTDTGTDEVGVSKNIYCPYGCSGGECEGTSVEGDMAQVWLTYGAGTVMLVLGTILGLPYGKISGDEKGMKKPFNTTLVVKYIFFFVGLFLVYLSFGMVRRVGSVYGGESNVTDATDTGTMVIMVTLILFLIVLVVEFVFYLIKWISHIRVKEEESKFGIEEEE